MRDQRFDEDARIRLKNLQIRMEVEKAESQAEIERLRYVELAGMQTELVQSEKMALLGRLVAGLSHEINTPVGGDQVERGARHEGARGAPRRGASTRETKPRLKKAIDTLTASLGASATASERLAELVGSLKSYARLDESALQHADVGECVSDSVELFRTQLSDEARLEVELRPVPKLLCRPGELNQVFMTLLVNASEAIREDGTIAVRCEPVEDDVVVSIRDDGRGIPEENLPTLFEIDFAHKDSRMRLRMGLSNAKTIVERHGGRIEVESVVGEGTTFEIRLPRRAARVPHFGGGFARARRG